MSAYNTPRLVVHGSVSALTMDDNPCNGNPQGNPGSNGDAKPNIPPHDCYNLFSEKS